MHIFSIRTCVIVIPKQSLDVSNIMVLEIYRLFIDVVVDVQVLVKGRNRIHTRVLWVHRKVHNGAFLTLALEIVQGTWYIWNSEQRKNVVIGKLLNTQVELSKKCRSLGI